ncbi:MAG: hypothetical protein ACRDHM_07730 [Actinomycetota bacterium]
MTTQRGQEGVSPAAPRSPSRDTTTERTIPPRLASALTGVGGLLVALGGIGTWIRATSLPTGSTVPEQVSVVTGRSGSGGWILLGIGIVTAIAALAWMASAARLRSIAPSASIVAIVFVSVRLALTDGRAAEMAKEAAATTGIETYHAGYGWGAWLMLVGAVLLSLGILAGGLRELDLRRAR